MTGGGIHRRDGILPSASPSTATASSNEITMTTIIFVRHAETNRQNHDERLRELSPQGMEDRKRVTEYLSEKKIDAVLSSPYQRAVDTVADYAQTHGFEIECIDDFRERELSGWLEDFDAFAKRQWEDFDYKRPGCESLREAQRRCVAALETVLRNDAGKTVVIGCHGVALSTVVNYYDSAFGYREFSQIKNVMPWIVELEFDADGSCTEIRQCDPIRGTRNTHIL